LNEPLFLSIDITVLLRIREQSAMSGKRKCPFADTSPQQFKTHITLKHAARMNDNLMKQMMDRTKTLLLDGQQKFWSENKENEAPVDVAVTAHPVAQCYTCNSKSPSKVCAHCSRYFCTPCSRQCHSCNEMFCTLCSVLNYDMACDRSFCLSCAP
jgi:hypothetical protein